jgi:flagellin
MALSLVNNVSALNAQNSLTRTNSTLGKSLERLSSGLKVNRGADGPAALVISEKQRAQIAGLQTAIDNTNKGVAVVQTAEGALNEVNSLLTKARGLALDSANSGVNDSDALAANQAEITNALQTIDRIANTTQFGSKKLLDGSAGVNATSGSTDLSGLNATKDTTVGQYTVTVTQGAQKGQVSIASGANGATALDNNTNLGADETLTFGGGAGSGTVALKAGYTNTQVRDAINEKTSSTGVVASLDSSTGALKLTAKNFGSNFTVVSDKANNAAGSTGVGTTALDTNTAGNEVVKTGQNIIVSVLDPGGGTTAGITGVGNVVSLTSGQGKGLSFTADAAASDDAITELDDNGVAADDTAVVTVADGTLTFQIGANQGQTADLSINKMTTDALGQNQPNNQFANLSSIDVTTKTGAQDALAVIDKAIDQVSGLRGTLGAFQSNTLETNANNLRVSLENTTAAESVIRDTDFAEEIVNFTRAQTQMQAGSTVLGNANQITQLVAGLLRG